MQPRTLELQPVTVDDIETWAAPRTSEQLSSFVTRLTTKFEARAVETDEADELELAA